MDNDARLNEWFITVNPDAESYESFKDIVESLNNCFYAYISHNKDTQENGELKREHKHIAIKFKNARTFNSMRNKFKGAHIEISKSFKKSVQYLIHLNDPDKYQYNPNEIISNDDEVLQHYLNDVVKTFPELNEQVLFDIFSDKVNVYKRSLIWLYSTYGNDQVKRFRTMICDMQQHYDTFQYAMTEEHIQNDEINEEELPF